MVFSLVGLISWALRFLENKKSVDYSRAPSREISSVPPEGVKKSLESPIPLRASQTSIQDYLAGHYPGSWTFERAEDGRIKTILGGLIPEVGGSLVRVIDLAKKVTELLGVPSDQLGLKEVNLSSSPRSTGFRFPQIVQGYPVFGSELILFSRKADGSIFMINNDLKLVDPIESGVRISLEEARKYLESFYSEKGVQSVELESPDRVVWANSKPHELAWSFIVELTVPKPDRLKVLVGVRSSSVLFEKSLIRY